MHAWGGGGGSLATQVIIEAGGKRRGDICWSHWSETNGRFRLPSATMNCGNDDPDRVGHLSGDGGQRIGAGLSCRVENRLRFYGATTFQQFDYCQQKR
jgi:hypothetical protein